MSELALDVAWADHCGLGVVVETRFTGHPNTSAMAHLSSPKLFTAAPVTTLGHSSAA